MGAVRLSTAQLNFGKVIPKDEPYVFIDITARSGGPFSRTYLAPEWGFLMEYKNAIAVGEDEDIANQRYTDLYIARLNRFRDVIIRQFRGFIKNAAMTDIVLGCYCRNGKFCHRHLLTWWMIKNMPELELGGELENESLVEYDEWNPIIVHIDGSIEERTALAKEAGSLFGNHIVRPPVEGANEEQEGIDKTLREEATKAFRERRGPFINLTGVPIDWPEKTVTLKAGDGIIDEVKKLLWTTHRVLAPTPLEKKLSESFAKYCEIAEERDARQER